MSGLLPIGTSSAHLPIFKGTNYDSWKWRIRNILGYHECLYVIDQQIPENPTSAWKKCNMKALVILSQAIDDSHISYARGEDYAKNIFQNLDAVFSRKDVVNELTVLSQLSSLRLATNGSLIEHFLKFDNLVQQLKELDSTSSELALINYLLLSLPEEYKVISSIIASSKNREDLTLVNVKGMLLSHLMVLMVSDLFFV